VPLEKCPHMAARCPHKKNECHDAGSSQCHYVATATASAMTTLSTFGGLGIDQLSEAQRTHLASMEKLLASLDDPVDPWPH